MKKQIELNGQPLTYTLRNHPRAKYLRLTVQSDGRVVVTAPFGIQPTAVEQFLFQKLDWLIAATERVKRNVVPLKRGNPQIEFLRTKTTAKKIAAQRIAHFNTAYNFSFSSINIRNQKSRWGSCSKLGRLNFNYKIALLPSELADYIIVHELCHLGELNHSNKFWDLIARTLPDYAARRSALKAYLLHA